MKTSLYTGTLSAKAVAAAMKLRGLLGKKTAEYDLDREEIDEWTKSQRERF